MNKFFDNIRTWLMLRYCPDYVKNMPEDKPGDFYAEAIISYGYWGNKYRVVASKTVSGYRQAYKTARWLALKAQWYRPTPLFSCGIHYGIKPVGEK